MYVCGLRVHVFVSICTQSARVCVCGLRVHVCMYVCSGCMCMCVCVLRVHVYVCMWAQGAHVGVRAQVLLPSCGSWEPNSGHQASRQVPLPGGDLAPELCAEGEFSCFYALLVQVSLCHIFAVGVSIGSCWAQLSKVHTFWLSSF